MSPLKPLHVSASESRDGATIARLTERLERRRKACLGLLQTASKRANEIAILTAERDALRGFVEDEAEGDCGYGHWDGETGSCIGLPRIGACRPCKARKLLAALAAKDAEEQSDE